MKRFFLMLTIGAGMIFLADSCSIGNDDNTNPQQGAFLLTNISPDAPGLNVKLNNSIFGNGLAYGIYTPYYAEPAGAYTFSFTDSTNATVLTNTVNIEVNKYYSYFLIDSFKRIKAAFVPDNLANTSTDSAFIRFFNFSPNAGILSLRDSATGKDWFGNRYFNDQAATPGFTNFTRVKAGIYTFQLKKSDSTLIASRKDTLGGGHTYSVFAKGNDGGTGVQAIGIGQIQNN